MVFKVHKISISLQTLQFFVPPKEIMQMKILCHNNLSKCDMVLELVQFIFCVFSHFIQL